VFDLFKKKGEPKEPPKRFPPVPDWRPAIALPLDRIAERVRYYVNGAKEFAMFEHGTCVILEDGCPINRPSSWQRKYYTKSFTRTLT
jgi:hypothetical protein